VKAYTVVWLQDAADQLIEIWLAASDRNEITAAVEALDQLLADDPIDWMSREVSEGLRAITVLPLRVIYVVRTPDRIVDVASVRYIQED
jgi:mRNA-degrading endonuclease RelE of RelBE toxin-antitoxin system